jgi:hypothetical protein
MHITPHEAEMLMRERTKDAQREAKQQQLRRLANSARPRLPDRVLASIGGLLLSAGERLQKRYAPDRTDLARSPSPATR